MTERSEKNKKKFHDPFEKEAMHEVDIGGTQSGAGTLGLTQPERHQRFEEPVEPDISLLKRSVTSMRGDIEPGYIEYEEPRTESEDEPGDEIS